MTHGSRQAATHEGRVVLRPSELRSGRHPRRKWPCWVSSWKLSWWITVAVTVLSEGVHHRLGACPRRVTC